MIQVDLAFSVLPDLTSCHILLDSVSLISCHIFAVEKVNSAVSASLDLFCLTELLTADEGREMACGPTLENSGEIPISVDIHDMERKQCSLTRYRHGLVWQAFNAFNPRPSHRYPSIK